MCAQVKNPQFFSNPDETLGKYSSYEVIIFPKFQKNWAKVVNFYLGTQILESPFL